MTVVLPRTHTGPRPGSGQGIRSRPKHKHKQRVAQRQDTQVPTPGALKTQPWGAREEKKKNRVEQTGEKANRLVAITHLWAALRQTDCSERRQRRRRPEPQANLIDCVLRESRDAKSTSIKKQPQSPLRLTPSPSSGLFSPISLRAARRPTQTQPSLSAKTHSLYTRKKKE